MNFMMSIHFVFIIKIALISFLLKYKIRSKIYSIYNNNNNNNNPIMDSENFYYLSLLNEPIINQKDHWGIHGLWPQLSKDKYPSYCKNVQFDYKTLEPILEDLDKYWYSDRGSSEKFWSHEWKKHGSCVFTEMNELEYFQETLDLYHEAIEKNIPNNSCAGLKQCLIPVSLDFKIN